MSGQPSNPSPASSAASRRRRDEAPDALPRPGTTLSLLVEAGCEEIPARYLEEAQRNLADRLRDALADAGLLPDGGPRPDSVVAYSTPRRLIALAPHVLKKQPDRTEQVLGPPVKVAFDAEGRPTRAAESFAAKSGVRPESLTRVTTPKGDYVAVQRATEGRASYDVLREALPAVIAGLAFPKSMYWTAKSGPRFIRPIRWLLAILGEGRRARVVPFEIAGVSSGCWTYRHRRTGNHRMRVRSFSDYAEKLREGMVEFDPDRRREMVREDIKALLQESGLKLVEDKGLEDWVVASTEWPHAILGHFEERFLKLPREILVTVMRDHQKYFAVEDKAGNLEPRFITVLNVDGDTRGVIRGGHERVLTARFTDAEFFWNADQKVPLVDRLPLLEKVTYHEKLGSYADKVRRMEVVARGLCRDLRFLTVGATENVLRAVQLCKCDLTTQMVQEFPELQGVVGGLYARAQGEPDYVADAIYNHYLPVNYDGEKDSVGAVVALSDKVDSVVAGFAAGLAPTGSSDPFTLRRQGNGIIKILIEAKFPISLWRTVQNYDQRVLGSGSFGVLQEVARFRTLEDTVEFFRERLRYYLESTVGLRYDTVRAVLRLPLELIPLDLLRRASALDGVRQTEDFEVLAVGAKRIRNILTKSASGNDWSPGEVEESTLEPGPEAELYQAYRAVDHEAGRLSAAGAYADALKAISTLRPAVDRFFDKVLVMAEEKAVRQNRLRLLGRLNQLFTAIADLSQIESTTLSRVDAPTSTGAIRDR